MDIELLTIEQVAERTGLSAHTLRYYERIGLLDPVSRATSGHRRYAASDLAWIEFLMRLRTTGMPIRHMQEFAALRRQGDVTIAMRRTLLEAHQQMVQAHIEELQQNLNAINQKIETYHQDEYQQLFLVEKIRIRLFVQVSITFIYSERRNQMEYDFRKRFQQMMEALQQNPHIRIVQLTFQEPASSAQIEEARAFVCGTFPEGLEAFYREMNGFTLYWEPSSVEEAKSAAQPGCDYLAVGRINILPIQETFSNWEGNVWFDDWEGGDLFKPVHPFDNFISEACTAFCLPESRPPENTVYYHYYGEELYNTAYTFVEYIERLLVSRGYRYWVMSLCEDAHEADGFFTDMPRLFADFQPELFRPRGAE